MANALIPYSDFNPLFRGRTSPIDPWTGRGPVNWEPAKAVGRNALQAAKTGARFAGETMGPAVAADVAMRYMDPYKIDPTAYGEKFPVASRVVPAHMLGAMANALGGLTGGQTLPPGTGDLYGLARRNYQAIKDNWPSSAADWASAVGWDRTVFGAPQIPTETQQPYTATSRRQQTHLRGGIPTTTRNEGLVNTAYNATAALRGTNPTFDTAYMNKYYPDNFPVNTYDPKVAKGLPGMGPGAAGVGGAALGQALQAAAARGDYDAINRYYASKGQTFAGMPPPKQRGQMSEADLWDMAYGPGVKSKAGRNRAANMLNVLAQSQGALQRQQLVADTALQGAQGKAAIQGAAAADLANYRQQQQALAQEKAILTAAKDPLTPPETKKKLNAYLDARASELGRSRADFESSLMQPTSASAEMINPWMNPTDGMARGGLVQPATPVLNPMGNMGMPQSMMSLDPMIRQYAQYVSTATQYGLQPVPLTKFVDLLAGTKARLQQMPTQMNAQMMAEGGLVDDDNRSWWQKMLGMPTAEQQELRAWSAANQAKQDAAAAAAQPPPSGAGMANIPEAMKSRKDRLDEIMNEIRGYADGGAINEDNMYYVKQFNEKGEFTGYVAYPRENMPKDNSGKPYWVTPETYNRNAPQRSKQTSNYAAGGAIPVAGRQVLGPGTGTSDSIPAVIDGSRPAALSSGEFVFPKQAVQFYGTDKLGKMIEKARGMK